MIEEVVIDKIKNGDSEAFDVIYEKYRDKVYKYIFYRVGTKADIEDLLQVVFAKVYKNINLYDKNKGNFYNFILINANHIIDTYLKKTMRRKEKFENNLIKFIKATETIPDEKIQDYEEIKYLRKIIGELPENYKMAITLFHLKNMSYKDSARIMGKSESSFRSILFRARKELKKGMLKEYPDMKDKASLKNIIKIVLILFVGMSMITGLVYATIKIYKEVFDKPKYTLSELREDLSDEVALIPRETAVEKINYYLNVLGRDANVKTEDLHLVKDYKLCEVCWMVKNEEYLIQINSESGEFIKYNNLKRKKEIMNVDISDLYLKLNLPRDYTLYEIENEKNSEFITYAKKYGEIYNLYQSATFLTIEGEISSIVVLNYSYEDKEVLISKEKALNILKDKDIKIKNINLEIELINMDAENDIEEINDISSEEVESIELLKTSINISKVWKIQTVDNKEYLIDAYTGEFIFNTERNIMNKNS